MVLIVAAMGIIPDQRAPLIFGLASVMVLLAAYGARRVMGRK
jgi:hypothetical protein